MAFCRKFSSCNAPQCPLDALSLDAPYLSGEPICLWLLEYSKGHHIELNRAIGSIPIEVIADAYFMLSATNGTLRNRLIRSKSTPSRLSRNEN